MSNVRICVEYVIGLIKTGYHIIDGPMPIRFIKLLRNEASGELYIIVVEKSVNVCATPINMENRVVYNEKYHFSN